MKLFITRKCYSSGAGERKFKIGSLVLLIFIKLVETGLMNFGNTETPTHVCITHLRSTQLLLNFLKISPSTVHPQLSDSQLTDTSIIRTRSFKAMSINYATWQ